MGCSGSFEREIPDVIIHNWWKEFGNIDPLTFLLHREKVKFMIKNKNYRLQWGVKMERESIGDSHNLPRVTYLGKEYGQSIAILRMFG